MKIFEPIENFFTSYVLIALNIAVILAAEFMGGGRLFADTGLIHGIVVVFVFLISLRIFSEYAFGDHILKGFLRIQLAFFFFLGLIHIYEYLGLNVLPMVDRVVELSVALSYLLWSVAILWAMEFIFRIYYKKSGITTWILVGSITILALLILEINFFTGFINLLPQWTPEAILIGVTGLGLAGMWSIWKIKSIMPVFKNYSHYAIPAMALIALATFSEYSESTHFLTRFGVSETQNLYLSHFLVFPALSLLYIGFGKLKRPTGIYAEA